MIDLGSAISTVLAMVLAAQLSAPETIAPSEDFSDQIITGAWGDPTKCNSANARSLSLSDAAQGNGVSKGDCVAITAFWKDRALFGSIADANQNKSMDSNTLSGRRVGLYADERTFVTAPRKPKPFKVVGTYASCESEWPGAMMVLGYCHYTDGPFLKVSQTMPANSRDVQ